MKSGLSLVDMANELTRQAESKKDFIAPTRKLSMKADSEGLTLEGVNGGMQIRSTAHQQLGTILGIPKVYYDRLLVEAPDLLATNVNAWLQKQESKRKLIRTMDGGVRAILSDGYRTMDNSDFAEAILPKLMKLDARVESAQITDSRFYIKAVSARITGEVKKGDRVQAGISASNSEIGQGSMQFSWLDYWLECLNGMVREQVMKRVHVGRSRTAGEELEEARQWFRPETQAADDRAMFLKIGDTVSGMFDQNKFDLRLNQYRDAASQVIDKDADTVVVVETVAKRLGIAESEQKGILNYLIQGGDLSKYGLANAVTRYAQDVDSYDRSTELEQIGGDIIELPRQMWRTIAGAETAVAQ